MFERITAKLSETLGKLAGRHRLTEANIQDAMREIRVALLDADVNLQVARDFIARVTQKAVGEDVVKGVEPGQQIVKIVYDELVALMGPVDPTIPMAGTPPTILMLAGLQGGGKTTCCAKLARLMVGKGRQPLLVAADMRRPAAIQQLQVLGQQLNVPVHAEPLGTPAVKVCQNAKKFAQKNGRDVVILDTQGRLHVDQELMDEVKEIERVVQPHQVYFVCDAMTGQDAVNSAKEFNAALELDGVILTKLDGDARGGAALSIKAVTGKPIKFIGVGEKLDRLEEFHPDRMAGRILGMGDVVSLVEKAQQAIDQEEARKMQETLLKGEFTLQNWLDQLQKVRKMGPIKDLLAMMPGLGSQMGQMEMPEEELSQVEAMIRSMTPDERSHPEIVDGNPSRRQRIARGSGVNPTQVSGLLKQYWFMRDFMKRAGRSGIFGRRGGLQEMMTELGQMGQPGFKFPGHKKLRLKPRRRVEPPPPPPGKRSKRPKPKRR
jgi:signal recognition particle subunit SRP54